MVESPIIVSLNTTCPLVQSPFKNSLFNLLSHTKEEKLKIQYESMKSFIEAEAEHTMEDMRIILKIAAEVIMFLTFPF